MGKGGGSSESVGMAGSIELGEPECFRFTGTGMMEYSLLVCSIFLLRQAITTQATPKDSDSAQASPVTFNPKSTQNVSYLFVLSFNENDDMIITHS